MRQQIEFLQELKYLQEIRLMPEEDPKAFKYWKMGKNLWLGKVYKLSV